MSTRVAFVDSGASPVGYFQLGRSVVRDRSRGYFYRRRAVKTLGRSALTALEVRNEDKYSEREYTMPQMLLARPVSTGISHGDQFTTGVRNITAGGLVARIYAHSGDSFWDVATQTSVTMVSLNIKTERKAVYVPVFGKGWVLDKPPS